MIQQARGILAKASADDRGILWTREQCLDIRVSKASLDRSLRILASLIATVEAEGFTVSVGNGHREHTIAQIYGQEIKFGLIEKVDRIEQVAAPTGSLVDRVLTYGGKPVSYEPAGKLSIEVWNVWGPHTKRWKDGKSSQLEELVPKTLAGFIRIAIAERAEKERRAAEEREHQRRIEERERRQAEIKAEQLKVRALRHLAVNWERAERLRSFIAAAQETAVHHGQATEPGTPFGEWLVWATQQADRLDPLKESPVSIIDLKSQEESPNWYGYRKPDPPFRFPKPVWRMQ